jgi:hypothetical protein
VLAALARLLPRSRPRRLRLIVSPRPVLALAGRPGPAALVLPVPNPGTADDCPGC